ncbi:TRAP transporter small permease subunit [Halotalea alkalilenta]|uniref:TRAP transporter small permease subunit n=1 Tax=Halotalea alkalilenta TaxID=376489 RepID=UPI00069380F4|nr:TRAP transporter small permease [Halotalea alkalilenta]
MSEQPATAVAPSGLDTLVRRLVRGGHRLSQAAAALAAVAMASLFVLMLAEIVARNLFSRSLGFSWEISGYLLGAVIFLGSGWTLRNGRHIRIMLLLEHAGPRMRRALDLVATLIAVLVVGQLVHAFSIMTWQSWANGVVSSTSEQFPLVWPRLAILLGLVVWEIQLLLRVLVLCVAPRLLNFDERRLETMS